MTSCLETRISTASSLLSSLDVTPRASFPPSEDRQQAVRTLRRRVRRVLQRLSRQAGLAPAVLAAHRPAQARRAVRRAVLVGVARQDGHHRAPGRRRGLQQLPEVQRAAQVRGRPFGPIFHLPQLARATLEQESEQVVHHIGMTTLCVNKDR